MAATGNDFLCFDPLPEEEPNKIIKSLKSALIRKPSKLSGRYLMDLMFLTAYLYVLGRVDECRRILEFIDREIVFSGDYDVWVPTGYQLVLLSRIMRESGERDGAIRTIQRIVDKPFTVAPPPVTGKFTFTRVRDHKKLFESRSLDSDKKGACMFFAVELARCWYHYEIGLLLGCDKDEKKKPFFNRLTEAIEYGTDFLKRSLMTFR